MGEIVQKYWGKNEREHCKMGKNNQNNKSKKTESGNTEKKEKVITRYDRKMEARRLQAEKEKLLAKRWKIGSLLACVCVICIIAGVAIHSIIKKQAALKDTYITVGNHELTQLEYDYYFNSTANNYINTYYSYLSYMGLDITKDFAEQTYSGDITWKDNFDEMAVNSITEIKAMADDAKAQGFEYDVTEDYTTYMEGIKSGASESGLSVAKYYQASFGKYATEKNMEPFIKEMLYAAAYNDHLQETMAPTEEEITTYYEENKNNYDKINYHVFQFDAELAEDAAEDAITAAMSDINKQADEMISRLEAGEDFETLCGEYAKEEQKENYNNADTEYSFHKDASYASTSVWYADWLYDEEREAGELTKIENTENHAIYVVRFDGRAYDESCRETISTRLASQNVMEYINGLSENYTVTDAKGNLEYLIKQETTAETTISETTNTESAAEETTKTEATSAAQ